jgi:hypothetical protein
LTVLCSETCPNAMPQNVTINAKKTTMNKKIIFKIITFTLIFNQTFGQAVKKQSNDTIIIQKLNYLEIKLQKLSKNLERLKNDSLVISIDKFEEIKPLIEKNDNDWLPSVIAILVVLISTGGAVFIGKKQINTQAKNAKEQLKSQEAQAKENLKIARKQIQETSKMTLAQVRANNISQARINWMQDLRNEITNFNGEVALINFYLQDVVEFNEKGEKTKAEKLYNNQIERIKNARQFAFKIKLFLNTKEDNHKKLEKLIDQYFKEALENYSTVTSDFNTITNDILITSRTILKEVWEQAKNEGK